MIKKIVLSISLIYCSMISNIYAESQVALPTNTKYLETLKTNNEVYDEIIRDYIKDVENRYVKTISSIDQANLAKDMSMKFVNQKIDKIKSDFKNSSNDSKKRNDENIKNIVKNVKSKNDIPFRNKNIKYPEYTTEIDLINGVVKENETTVKKSIKTNIDKQKNIIKENFSNEESIFLEIFKNKMKEFTVTKEEKEFLEKSIKETTIAIKENPISINEKEIDNIMQKIDKDVTNYTLANDIVLSSFKESLGKLDRNLFNVRWKYSRSKSIYPEKNL